MEKIARQIDEVMQKGTIDGKQLATVEARQSTRGGMRCWFVDVEFENGTLGHLDLTVAVRMDWHEGFQIYGANGSILGKTYNPWYYKSSEVDIFHDAEGASRRVLGADGHFYRRQLEGFADTILTVTEVDFGAFRSLSATIAMAISLAVAVGSARE